jgi:hypothetical protein
MYMTRLRSACIPYITHSVRCVYNSLRDISLETVYIIEYCGLSYPFRYRIATRVIDSDFFTESESDTDTVYKIETTSVDVDWITDTTTRLHCQSVLYLRLSIIRKHIEYPTD